MTEEVRELNEIELEEETLEEEAEITPEERKIYTDKGDPEIESLYNKYKRGKLVLQPNFQRYFVWDSKKSSRLIESALLDIPLPVIYLSEEKDGEEHVIDGQQRLTAFFSFIFESDTYFTQQSLGLYLKVVRLENLIFSLLRSIIRQNLPFDGGLGGIVIKNGD